MVVKTDSQTKEHKTL